MREIITKAYQFDELSDDAKEQAVTGLYDVNVHYDWWDGVYDDASQSGIVIKEFDIDRGSYCGGSLTLDTVDVAKAITANHGESCDTHKLASSFLLERAQIISNQNAELTDEQEEAVEELDVAFERDIFEEYRSILSKEYDYLTSEEAIIETIKANEYEFTEEGELI